MFGKSAVPILVACVLCLGIGFIDQAEAQPEQPPYVILLRSRDGVVTPERTKHAETGGGFIQVTQISLDKVLFVQRGAVAAGDDHPGRAAMQFALNQDLDIQATRAGLRPPRLVVTAWVIGSLHSSLRNGGTAEHSPACVVLRSGGNPLVNLCIKPHGVGGGENVFVNERAGPVEVVVAPGPFCLTQTFALNAVQERTYHSGAVSAHFDPDPRLDTHWYEVLKPFRAVPHKDFGFRVILRVVEDPEPDDPSILPPPKPDDPSRLPPPRPVDQGAPPRNGEDAPQ